MRTSRYRWLILAQLGLIALSGACGPEPEQSSGSSGGTGGVGPILYSTNDATVPTWWHHTGIGVSDYVGAGGDSQQPPLQPRPEVHADLVALVGDRVASLAVYWPARSAELRLASLSAPNTELDAHDLAFLAAPGELDGDGNAFFRRFERASLFALAQRVVLILPADDRIDLVVFEVSNDQLAQSAQGTLPFGIEFPNLSISERPEPPMGWPRVVLTGSTLVFQARRPGPTFEVVDLSNGSIDHVASIDRGAAEHVGPIRVVDGLVLSERRIPTPSAANDVSYLVDRLDVSNGQNPVHIASVNVPGTVLSAGANGRFLVSGYDRAIVKGVTTCCPGAGGCAATQMTDECEVTRETVSIVEIQNDGSVKILDAVSPEPALAFEAVTPSARGAYGVVGYRGVGDPPESAEAVSLGDLASGEVALARSTVAVPPGGGPSRVVQDGQHLAFEAGYGATLVWMPVTPSGALGPATAVPLGGPAIDLVLTPSAVVVATGTAGVSRIDFDAP